MGEGPSNLQDQDMEGLGFASTETRFQCTICGDCCQLEVFLTSTDVERIRLRKEAESYAEELSKSRSTLVAGEGKAACLFLRSNRCSIYESRPLQCRLYPFFPIAAEVLEANGITMPPNAARRTRGSTVYYFSIGQRCPGLGRGPVPEWEDILSTWLQYVKEEKEETRG
jgi:Fe-S-cluster containining protein